MSVKCPPTPTFGRQEVRVTRRGEGATGGRSPPVLTVHTGACVTLLETIITCPFLCHLTSPCLQLYKINFAFLKFSQVALHEQDISTYLSMMQVNRSWLFSVAHFIRTNKETFLSSHESFQISPICSRLTIFPRYFLSLHPGYF